jgi:hypothetical protein
VKRAMMRSKRILAQEKILASLERILDLLLLQWR